MNARQHAIALLLMVIVLLSLSAKLAFADDNNPGNLTLVATGTATPLGNSGTPAPSSAMLTITGSVSSDGNNLKFFDLTGRLAIGEVSYQVTDGQGQSDQSGNLQLNATSIGGQSGTETSELVLQGSMQSDLVTFDPSKSQLGSQYSLSLSGQVDLILPTSVSAASSPINPGNSTISSTTENSTGVSNSAVSNNVTSSQTILAAPSNETTVGSGGATVTITQTVTTTEVSNHTVTETLANLTLTQTVIQPNATVTATTTVANETITVNATVTVANTTITVTNAATT
jgi:hypothetical protein